jgi:GNAT superfamily N-acetyltransferase
MVPHHITDRAHGPAVLSLLQRAFAGMQGRIDPPSSLHHLTVDGLFDMGEVWALGAPVIACVVMMPRKAVLYLGKWAVDPAHQGQGHGRRLLTQADARARALGLQMLELQTRVELCENHGVFRAFGFAEAGRSAHPGYDRSTIITFHKEVPLHA